MKTSYDDSFSPLNQDDDWDSDEKRGDEEWDDEILPLESRFQRIQKETPVRAQKRKFKDETTGSSNRNRHSNRKNKRQRFFEDKDFDAGHDDE